MGLFEKVGAFLKSETNVVRSELAQVNSADDLRRVTAEHPEIQVAMNEYKQKIHAIYEAAQMDSANIAGDEVERMHQLDAVMIDTLRRYGLELPEDDYVPQILSTWTAEPVGDYEPDPAFDDAWNKYQEDLEAKQQSAETTEMSEDIQQTVKEIEKAEAELALDKELMTEAERSRKQEEAETAAAKIAAE
ncbi:MAG: hypothetical protein AAGA35_01205 [Patescibacteria group bacterium]